MGRPGGPCRGPGRNGKDVCGETEVPDTTYWRTGKGEYVGMQCCNRNACMVAMGLKKRKGAPRVPAEDAPAPTSPEPMAPSAPPVAAAAPTADLIACRELLTVQRARPCTLAMHTMPILQLAVTEHFERDLAAMCDACR